MEEKLLKTLQEILALAAPTGQEEEVAKYCEKRLQQIGFSVKKDQSGNVIGFLPGKGETLLLSAHMDRVPPGKGLIPIREGDVLKTDGSTNLGADDGVGIAVILEAITEAVRTHTVTVPLLVVFTVSEEIGLKGAREADLSEYQVTRGIAYDNAFEAGTVVGRGATYVGFDVEIKGKASHPGKALLGTINVLEVFQKIDWSLGASDEGQSRINIGMLSSGTARNVIPETITIQGELRTTLPESKVVEKLAVLQSRIQAACKIQGATYTFVTDRHSSAYTVSASEPLLLLYGKVLREQGRELILKPTFVGSDTNVFRSEKGMAVFTISTGVFEEHTVAEYMHISDMLLLAQDLLKVLERV